nr:serine hydroxymethyltransferase 4-like isoform X2 [Physcomitrium patens]|eukprot:XP_024374345.1 serine hydroxymethyltransferase 4-like isoform X2 [Physcomitrella patens]
MLRESTQPASSVQLQITRQSVQQQMSAGGQVHSTLPALSRGSSLSDAIQVETAMQITSRDSAQLLRHKTGASGGFSPLGSTQGLKRKSSALLSGQFRTPTLPASMAGRNNSASCGQQSQLTYHHSSRGSQPVVHQMSHGAFRAVVSSDHHQNGISKPVLNYPSNMSPRVVVNHNSYQTHDNESRKRAVRDWGNRPLAEVDPDLWKIMEKEKSRQWKGIELVASENFTSLAVFEALGSHLTNKYSEGLPGSRYYKGNEYIDQIESLCISRALAAFHLDNERWGVNVQPYSCSSANFAVYTALLQPNDRIMGLDVLSGGHVSHGYHTQSGKKIPAASIYFQTLPFKVHPETGLIDYDKVEEIALLYRPKILICGGSSYPREWNYSRFRQVADKIGAVLMCDMAHISGLVAAQECLSPFDYCDVVTTTTHKSLRGPRGGMIFFRKGLKSASRPADGQYNFEKEINIAVHPTLQGGPHNNHIAALAAALKQAASAEYKAYIQQVIKNAQSLAEGLKRRGCKLVTDGTDNHLMLWDLRPFAIPSSLFEEVCEACHITVNKSAVYGDSSSFQPGGVRIGTPAMTSRGCNEGDFDIIADLLHRAVQITTALHKENPKQQRNLGSNSDVQALRAKVEEFATAFEMPGFDVPC